MTTKTLFSQFIVKSFDEDLGIIRGIATTPTTDKVGDIIEPMGAEFSLPLPLCHEHDRKDVVGEVIEATATADGIEFTARIAKDVSGQIAEVWRRVQAGLIKFVSVGMSVRAGDVEVHKQGRRFKKWTWQELSLVAVPANPQAAITATKAAPLSFSIHTKGITMTLAQQIASFQAKKSAALASMDVLVNKGTTLIGHDETSYAASEAEIVEIDKHLARLQSAEDRQAKSAQPITVTGVNVQVTDNTPKGMDFVRYTKAMILSNNNPMMALEIAKGMNYGNRVETVLKAAVSAGSTTSPGFTTLLQPQLMASEFIDLLRPNLILSKMSQMRQVPSNITIPRASTGTTSGWIGEGKPAPVTNAAFDNLVIGEHKIGCIAVFTEELLRRSEPAAEGMVRDDMLSTVANAIDVSFIDQANAGVATVKPASIASAAATAAASGITAAAVRVDVKAAYLAATAANQSLASACWIMNPATALGLSMMFNATTSQPEFPGIDFVTGGTFQSLPVVLSTNVPGTLALGYDVILAVQNEILVAEGGLAIDASREASLEFSDAPTNDAKTPTATQLVSLWQTGSVGIKVVRNITWLRRRPTAVYRISAAKYA